MNTYISYTTFSDHNFVCMNIDFSNIERGQGIWIFNNDLLQDENFSDAVITIINNACQCPLFESEPLVWWDNLKYKLKKCAMYHAIDKRKAENEHYYYIQNALRREYAKLAVNTNHDITNIQMLEEELNIIEYIKCKGAILRSKVQWNLETDKNTSFFLNLEKSKQKSNAIKEIKTNNGTTRKTEDILKYAELFYSKLYTQESIDEDKEMYLINLIHNKLDDIQMQTCDRDISVEELTNALKGMNKNKSPGIDGLTVEFYVKFWDILKHLFHKVVINIKDEEQLSRSMKKGVISLFYKKKGDKTDLKNFRPISLLNVDYKLISRVLANRLKQVMSRIISPEQTCCVPGRDIADNIMSIRDVIDLISLNNKEGYIVKIDQEKAFDRVSHNFILKVLKKFNFGNHFISWIKLLYKDIKSRVKINGHLTPYFSITRGVRQGCPISMMLYCIVAEPLNNLIRHRHENDGIQITHGINSIIFQHADDTTITVNDVQSVENVFNSIDIYCKATGAKVNIDKSEVLCIGNANNNDASFKIPVSINKECVKILGVYLGPKKKMCEQLNWANKISKIKTLIHLWSQRKLTLKGKAIVWNTLLITKLWYIVSTINVPNWIEKEIQTLFNTFMWGGKIPLIKYSTIVGDKLSGGLNVQDVSMKKNAFRIKLLKKYYDNDLKFIWKYTMSVFLSKYMSMDLTTNIFNIVYNKTDLTAMNPFYAELLSAWDIVTEGKRHFHLDINDILLEPLFNNPHIKYKEKLLIFNSFIDSGIITVADIAYEVKPGFLPVLAIIEIIHEKYPNIDKSHISLAYAVILHSLPEEWKTTVKSMDKNNEHQNDLYLVTDKENINVSKFNVKLIYNIMISKCFKIPTSIEKWSSLGFNIVWKPVWKAITYPDKSPEFVELDFKIAHNIIFTYKKLYNYNKATSKHCPVCMNIEEDLCHLFLYCDELQDLIPILHELCIGIFQKTGFSLQQLK